MHDGDTGQVISAVNCYFMCQVSLTLLLHGFCFSNACKHDEADACAQICMSLLSTIGEHRVVLDCVFDCV